MAIIVHPLTAVGGVPAYTADDYRHVVNPLMVPSNGLPFDGLQGVRAGFQLPLVTLNGLDVTVNPHCGTVCPYGGSGVYTYAITLAETVKIADSNASYKVAVVVDDPTLGSSDTPGGRVQVFPTSVPDSNIPGLVIALVSPGAVSTVAPVLHPRMLVEVFDENALKSIPAVDGQEVLISSTGSRYVRENGLWHNTLEVSSFDWLNGKISFLYGADSCTVQVTGVVLDSSSWSAVEFKDKVKPACRPAVEISVPLSTENGASVTGLLAVSPSGAVSVRNMGGTGSNGKRRGSVSWPISRRY